MLNQVTNQAVMWKMIAGVIGVIAPIAILVIWKRKTGSKIKPAVVGAIIFIVFSQILEGIPKAIFFSGTTSISNYVWSHAWAYVLIGCLLAGIFEETGRFVGFHFFMKKFQNRKDAVTYGIGHGGMESILILGIVGISSVGLAGAVNNGSLEQSMSAMSTGQVQAVELQVATIAGYGLSKMLLEILERLLAMTLQIALSVVVFQSVREKKIKWLFLAILLHFFMGFSLLSMLEFLIRETETCETINHLLCGWRQIVVQKNHLSVIIELFRLLQ